MSEFLAVEISTIVDTPFSPAVPAVPEVLAPDGVTVVEPAVPAVPEQPLVSHEEVTRTWVEKDAGTVVRVLEQGSPKPGRRYEYYQIQFNGTTFQATLHPVSIKAGVRQAAPAREVVEIQANGQDVGSAIMEA